MNYLQSAFNGDGIMWLRAKVNIRLFMIIFITIIFSNNKVYAVDTMLKVAIDPNMPPYQFVENDRYVGLHVDILNKLADRYGFKIEYIPFGSTSKCIEALENGQVDVVLGVILNDNIKYKVQLTDSISQSSICMVAHNSKIKDVQGNVSSIISTFEDDTVRYSFIHNISNLKSIVVSNQVRAFNMLVSKKADVLIGVKNSVLYQLEKANLENEYTIVNNYMVSIEYGMAVKSGDEELQKKINNGLQKLRLSGEYEKLHDKWINENKYVIDKLIQKITYIFLIALTIIAAVFIFNLRLNFLLKKQVNEKTKELKKTNMDLELQIIETRNNNELKNCIVENSPSGIIVFDKECKITLFNQSASALMDIDELPIGQSVFEIELLKSMLIDKMDAVFLKESRFLNKEIVLRKDNESICYRYNIYQLFDLCSNVRGAILTLEDITKESKLKEQMYEREKNKALNQIIAGIAHEVRNPLATIKTFVELIPRKIDNEEFQYHLLELVPKEVDRVSSLIKNLIDYAKPGIRNMEIINISDLIKSSTALIVHVLENERIELNTDVDEELTIQADKNQLKQVLINIILNGAESVRDKIKSNSESNNKLNMYINAWEDEQYIFIQIIDEGIGMTEDEIKKSTEPFFTTKSVGTGLGLYISKQYVEKNGGTLSIESQKNLYTKITLRFGR